MKKCFYYMLGVILLAAAFSLTSCSLDEPLNDPLELEPAQGNLSATTDVLNLMQRTASNDGSWDNIVDGSSCFSIRFPYEVTVGELKITIAAIEDLVLIENIFDAIDSDQDTLDILFPITVTLADYTEVVVNNKDELLMLATDCIEGGADDDIECIDVIYPITVFTFSSSFEQTGSVTVENDSELRRFFNGLTATDVVGFDFPISLELYDDSTLTVNSNAELSQAIEKVINACDEDDDNDYGDDDFTKERLDGLLVACSWVVSEVKRNNEYATVDYANYILNFTEDGFVTATDTRGVMISGEWSTEVIDFRVVLSLRFEGLNEFNLAWLVDDIDAGRIKLFTTASDKIVMKQFCDAPMVECTEAFIQETISECLWEIATGDSSYVSVLRIDFSFMNIHVFDTNDRVIDEGNWEIYGNIVTFNNLSLEFANFNGEWEVIECSLNRFKLKRGDETFIIEKDCS